MQLLYIDLFCGAGGTSTGVETARLNKEQCAKVIACVNHDKNAIASHAANHPDALHFTEDIRTLELSSMKAHLKKCRAEYPNALVVLWASLECTNFSKAKGGQPRDADSRTLAEHLFRYIDAIQPDYIQIENVEEFMSWGPLDENGKPVSKDKGTSYVNWVNKVCEYGYIFDYRILNSADYGAITSRKRFFGIFAKDGLPIVFPAQTHAKKPTSGKKKWGAVRNALDFDDKGKSMFGRKKPLVDASLKRIYAGLIKFVAGGKDAFLLKYNSINQAGKYMPPSIDEPCPTVTTQNRLGLVSVCFLSKAYGGDPMSKNSSIDDPAGTITTIDHHQFISIHYGNGVVKSLDEPAPTITTKDRCALVNPTFIVNQYFGVLHDFIAMTDKGLVYHIYDTDSEPMKQIKEFMALYNIVDIKVRMLRVSELKKIMGFPEDYVLIGTQAEQKKYIGNAVEVTMARVLCEALCNTLLTMQRKVA